MRSYRKVKRKPCKRRKKTTTKSRGKKAPGGKKRTQIKKLIKSVLYRRNKIPKGWKKL